MNPPELREHWNISPDELRQILSEHQMDLARFHVRSLSVFGSAARGEGSAESDMDLLVEFTKPVGLFRFLDLKAYLEQLLNRSVDLVTADAIKPQLRDRILREAVHAF